MNQILVKAKILINLYQLYLTNILVNYKQFLEYPKKYSIKIAIVIIDFYTNIRRFCQFVSYWFTLIVVIYYNRWYKLKNKQNRISYTPYDSGARGHVEVVFAGVPVYGGIQYRKYSYKENIAKFVACNLGSGQFDWEYLLKTLKDSGCIINEKYLVVYFYYATYPGTLYKVRFNIIEGQSINPVKDIVFGDLTTLFNFGHIKNWNTKH